MVFYNCMSNVEKKGSNNNLVGSVDICGFAVPKNKRIVIALQSVYGVGLNTANLIIKHVNLTPDIRMGLVKDEIVHSIREYVKQREEAEELGNSLRRKKISDISRLKEMNSYRGRRHRERLPCRGQNTHSNHKKNKWRVKTKNNKKR